MIVLAWIVLSFTVIQLLVALVNLIFSQPFHRQETSYNALVSVLIPARNEEKNIAVILSDLQQLQYKNLEIIVFNDQSEDKTAEIVKEFAKKDVRIKLINSTDLPAGWLGKNHACYSLAKIATGEYFLFIDADVRVYGKIISETVTFSENHKLGLLSIFPRQIMKSRGEWFTVPNMNYILLTLLPLILVRKTGFQSLAAANGQFMLFKAAIYNKLQPHEKMKSSKVEDIQIARYLKKNKIKTACVTSKYSIQCRMYSGFGDAVNGFSKNVTMFFGDSFIAAILFWLITSLGFVVVIMQFPLPVIIFYLLAFILIRVAVSAASSQNILKNILFIVPQQLTMGLFITKAIENKLRKRLVWKGRSIS